MEKWTVKKDNSLFVVLFGFIHSENKGGTHTFRTDDIDGLLVGRNNFLADGESQTGAQFVFAPG